MTRKPRHTAARAEQEAQATESLARRDAADRLRAVYERAKRRPGFADSTSHNTREFVEGLIADLEQGS